jgi:N utilization substance protein A
VGVRGNRIKNIVDELAGERIDIVRWSDDLQVLIPNALQPAEVEEVILCQMLGRAIVLVREDQLSLAIGRRGQNVRLASKLCGWDIEIMTREELDEQIEQAVVGYASLDGVEEELAEKLVGEGFLSYDDLSVIEPDALTEMGNLTTEQVSRIVRQAEVKAQEAEQAAAMQRRLQREQERLEAETADAAAAQDDAEQTAAAEESAAETDDLPASEATDWPGDLPPDEVGDQAAADQVSVERADVEVSLPPATEPAEPTPPPPHQVNQDPPPEAGQG